MDADQTAQDNVNGRSGAVVVFGASGGIGSAICRRLLDGGQAVVGVSRDAARLDDLANAGGHVIEADVSRLDEAKTAIDEAESAAGPVTGIVNAVGSILLKPAHLTTPDEWSRAIETNLTTAFAAVRAAGSSIRGPGSVVLFSTAAARAGLANHDAIAAVKGGIDALVRSAAATYAGRGLRFNAIAPGLVRTPLSERITGNPNALKSSEAMHPLGRIGEADDIASAACWLLHPENDWVTGQVIGVDGGLANCRSKGAG